MANVAAFAEQVHAAGSECATVVRLEYDTYQLLGYKTFCGPAKTKRPAAVYVDPDNCQIPFDIEVGGVTHPGQLGRLDQTCFAARSRPGGCCDCISPGTPVPPGESWETHWSGLFYDPTEVPPSCYGSLPNLPVVNRRCVQPAVAAPGPMRVLPYVFATAGKGAWPTASDGIPLGKDFVFGTDNPVEVIVE